MSRVSQAGAVQQVQGKTVRGTVIEANGPAPPDENAVRERAYQLWEAAGRPEGDGVDFWFQAERELAQATSESS